MNEVDFIPDFWRRRRTRRRMIARSAVLLLVAAGLMATWPVLSPLQHLDEFERYLETLDTQIEAEERRRDEAQARDLQTRALRDLLAMRADLEPPVPTTAILAILAELMPPAMGLTSLSVAARPVEPPVEKPAEGSGAPRDDREPGVMRLAIEGLAPEGVTIAQFIGKLDGAALFEEVELGFSRPVEDLEIIAHEFQITTVIPLDREFIVAETEEAGAD